MKLISDFLGGILRAVIKVALLLLTVLFVLGVLIVGLVVVLAAVIRFLLTGRKPAVVTTFTRFNQAARQFRPGNWSGHAAGASPDSADVVDVQAHEVRSAPPHLPPSNIEKFR
ncbi:MAG: hypothetical protein K9K35_08010 [Rhodoferax sp.]|jgi:hypothetical protein|nr:hypothetical protein [Rhodoferax sp.]